MIRREELRFGGLLIRGRKVVAQFRSGRPLTAAATGSRSGPLARAPRLGTRRPGVAGRCHILTNRIYRVRAGSSPLRQAEPWRERFRRNVRKCRRCTLREGGSREVVMGQSREARPIVLSRSWIGGCSYRLELDFGPEWKCPGLEGQPGRRLHLPVIETWSGPILPDLSGVPQDAFGVQAAHVQDNPRTTAGAADSATMAEGCKSGHEPACAPGGSPVQPVICSC